MAASRKDFLVIIGVLLIAGISCAHAPNLDPHVSYLEISEQIKKAQLIIVGVVENESNVRRLISGTHLETTPLELREVRIRVEGSLEGNLSRPDLSFYYYRVMGAWDGAEPNLLGVGERSIFYLVRDAGIWRSTTDGYLSHTRLLTGDHSNSPVIDNVPVQQTIARLLLVPSKGAELDGFLGSLRRTSALAMGLVGRAEVSHLLRDLLMNPSPEVRGHACIALAEFPLNEKGCLTKVVQDIHALPEDRKRAQELFR